MWKVQVSSSAETSGNDAARSGRRTVPSRSVGKPVYERSVLLRQHRCSSWESYHGRKLGSSALLAMPASDDARAEGGMMSCGMARRRIPPLGRSDGDADGS